MNNSFLFLRSGSRIIYSTSQDSTLPVIPHVPMEHSFSLKDSMPGHLQSCKTFLPEIYAAVAHKSNMVLYSASDLNWLQTRLFVQFVALLTISSTKNFQFQNSNYPSIREFLMFSPWIRTQLLSSILHPKNVYVPVEYEW